MPREQDFDFRIGRGHYRGRGTRGLVALALVQLPRAAFLGTGIALASPGLTWSVQAFRALMGH
jgi:hypothetical protein